MAYLEFNETKNTGKTKVFEVNCNDAYLGQIKWYSAWRRYCFFPLKDVLFDASCLNEVVEYINTLMDERKLNNS